MYLCSLLIKAFTHDELGALEIGLFSQLTSAYVDIRQYTSASRSSKQCLALSAVTLTGKAY